MSAEKFTIDIPEATLADLRDRLRRTRWADDFANDDWSRGTNGRYLGELVEYWIDGYDWRRHERAINVFDHYRATIDDVPVHFIHARGKGPAPIPLILSHGWPWTFWDWHKVIGPLSDPAAHGGDPRDAFDVVVPSLPGFGFSTPLTKPGINFWRTADLWDTLMREVLGYPRYAAGGGDWGALITAQLGHKYAANLIGVYIHLLAPLDIFLGELPPLSAYGPDETEWYARNQRFFAAGSGYSAVQTTRPQTLAFALEDSPAGLCAWILDKRRAWSDCGGNVETRFSKDDLLTTMTIYWATRSFHTSARYYYECVHNPWSPSHARRPVVEAPTGVGVFPREVIILPRRWAEEYYNLRHWTRMPAGGHFAPMEEPARLVEDIRAFYRGLRR